MTSTDEHDLGLPLDQRLEPMLRRRMQGDYVGALVLADSIVRERPEHGLALVCLAECRDVLRFGDLDAVPRPLISITELHRVSIHPRGIRLLSRVDGVRTVSEILDVDWIERAEALRLLAEFVRRRLASFGAWSMAAGAREAAG